MAPAGTTAVACTVATEGLLLNKEILAPPLAAAAVSVTVPWPRLPAATLEASRATPDTAEDESVGAVGEPEQPY